ncbi:hypothetical protein WG907_15410 [Sphingobium sp. AN558]|uniref:hypothetical protein n=1 Tax=Sphingobium sp. AN558 TaxID=3133442 RepID=UPI0030C3E08A
MTEMIDPLPALPRLILVYASPAHRRADSLIWSLDTRLAGIIRSTRDPLIGQMRIVWWEEALGEASGATGRGDPLLDALRIEGVAGLPALQSLLGGWEALLNDEWDDAGLKDYADGRGGGLFAALGRASQAPSWLAAAGRLWAYWDLSGHVRDNRLQQRAIVLARRELAALEGVKWPRQWKALRLLTGLASHDVRRGRAAPLGLTPGLYMRVLWLSAKGG